MRLSHLAKAWGEPQPRDADQTNDGLFRAEVPARLHFFNPAQLAVRERPGF